ncbi:hypothetical protein L3N51_01506 [Metallosphaera sp. J1]|uniref:hypothetical protein n=1 Tax=Metallosphaera javensis (ex Hofmann et al. 2022) TaxID=99938 RepID=UPI001EDD60F7|nr:hypothetical protein [Metallosphaera javensis (ex Hofmann et al. 2022)]MCG3109216.1 hypothetical protein [Metallosphaera javensis (ex Hofmann et al. 2022)]
MTIVFPTFNYSVVYLGALKISSEKDSLKMRIKNLMRKGTSYEDLVKMVELNESIPTYNPIAPDGSFIVKLDDTFLEALGKRMRNIHRLKDEIPLLFVTRIEKASESKSYSDHAHPYNNLLVGITLEKDHDHALVTKRSDFKASDPRTAKYMWSLIYFNGESLKHLNILGKSEFPLEISLDYPAVMHKGIWTSYNLKKSSVQVRSKFVAYYLSSSFNDRLSNEKVLLDASSSPLRILIKTGGLSIEDIMVGSEIYFKGRTEEVRYPFLFPHIIPYTFLSERTTITRLPSDIYVDAGALRVEVELKEEDVDQFLKEICEASKTSLNHFQFIQKLGLEWAVSDVLSRLFGRDEVSYWDRKIEELVKFQFPNDSYSFSYTSFIFNKMKEIFNYFEKRNDTMRKTVETCDINTLIRHVMKSITSKITDSQLNELDLKLEEFKIAVAISALNKSLHGLSHLLIKSLQNMMGLQPRSLGEIITIYSKVTWDRNYDGVIRYHNRTQKKIKGQLTIFLRKSLTSDYFEQVLSGRLNTFLTVLHSILVDEGGEDKCTSYWNAERSRLEYVYSTLASSSDVVGKGRTRGEIIKALDRAMTSTLPESNLYFHYPRQMYRYIYLNRASLVKTLELDRKNNDSETKEVLSLARKYSQYVWPRRIHQCFDGCYNCVMIEKGCTYVDLQQLYKVSRVGASYLLEKIRNSSSS